jgi:Effector-associated domain 7
MADNINPRQQLYNALSGSAFSLEDLEGLSFRLNVDWDELKGQSKSQKARELISYFEAHGRLDVLAQAVMQARPNLAPNTIDSPTSEKGKDSQQTKESTNIKLPKLPKSDFDSHAAALDTLFTIETIFDERLAHLEDLGIKSVKYDNQPTKKRYRLTLPNNRLLYFAMTVNKQFRFEEITFLLDSGYNDFSTAANAIGTMEWDIEQQTAVISLLNLSMLGIFDVSQKRYTPTALAEAIWEEVCKRLEQLAR